MHERKGEAFEFDQQLTVVGRQLQPGDQAPDFQLDSLDASSGAISTITLADTSGRPRLLSVVNSLDTPVCHVETRRWQELSDKLPEEVAIYTISMDLPFAQARWQGAEGVTHQVLSSHRSEQFGQDYGVLLKEWRLLQRAVFVLDRDGKVLFSQYVADQMAEPDYQTALEAALQAVG